MSEEESEIVMTLKSLYYSLDSPASFSGQERLYKEAKKQLPNVKHSDVREWLKEQLTYTRHRSARINFKTRQVMVYTVDQQWCMDLVFLPKLAKVNRGYKYLLTCIDVLSKFLWVVPLKTKTGVELTKAFNIILQSGRQPITIQVDRGTEFYNRTFQRLLAKKNIKMFSTNSERKATVVESVNRTFKQLMFTYFTYKNTKKYIDVLPQLVTRYNRGYHRSIQMRPEDVNAETQTLAWMNLYGKKSKKQTNKPKLKVGDKVCISHNRNTFRKGFLTRWTAEIFKVTHVIPGSDDDVTVYRLEDLQKESITGTFYEHELQSVYEPPTSRIDKVLRKKRVNNQLLYFVRWEGYPDSFNSWIPASDITTTT